MDTTTSDKYVKILAAIADPEITIQYTTYESSGDVIKNYIQNIVTETQKNSSH